MTGRLADLPIAERTALMRRLRERQREAPPAAGIPVRPGPRHCFPLSFAQLRLWLLHQADPESTAYHLLDSLELAAPPAAGAPERALAALLARHEVLRTALLPAEGEPVQELRPAESLRIQVPRVDLSRLPPRAREGEEAAAARALAGRPFDLAAPPLFRQALLLAEPEPGWATWLFCFHHVAYDGWSSAVFQRELAALLAAAEAGAAALLPPLPVQYGDYAAWQRDRLAGPRLAELVDWWRRNLERLPERLELPTDRPRLAAAGRRGARLGWQAPPGLAADLAELARRQGVTLFSVLWTVFALLLGRLAETADVAAGTPIAHREPPETQGLIGFFVNTLVLVADLAGVPTFAALLSRLHDGCLAAFAHQELPFDRLVAELKPRRALAANPLVDVVFSHEAVAGWLPPAGSAAEPVAEAKFELTVSLVESPGALGATVEHRTDLWDSATVARWLRLYENLLAEAARDPHRPPAELAWLSAAERRQAIAAGWAPATDSPLDRSVPELFAEQAAARPDAVALVGEEAALTYGALAAAAANLAARLAEGGVGRGDRVGILAPPGFDLVTAMLAILAGGGAYVPLEVDAPAPRLVQLAADAGLAAVAVPAGAAVPEVLAGIPALPIHSPAASVGEGFPVRGAAPGPDDAAYVLYTSGSTGSPKGVVVPHRAIVRLVRGNLYLDFGPADRVAQAAHPAFDAITFEVWGALLNGGAVVFVDREVWTSAPRLAAWLPERGVTALFVTAALFDALVDRCPGLFAGVAHVLVGGDAVDPVHARRALLGGAPGRLVNGYGPTEVTTFATFYDIRPDDEEIPIGFPIGHTRAHVLDAAMEPMPDGVPGELFLGGDGLARGYLGHPERTAASFVPDPFGEPGGRLYKSGDRARRRPADGALLFLGRRDRQVKLRGFRVEPGEVESALLAHPAVREARVEVAGEASGRRRLVAYLVAAPEAVPAPAELAEFLSRRLPSYMLPSAWVTLPAFPLTANGKLDRRALPPPSAEPGTAGGGGEPRDETERLLERAMAESLGLDRIGVDDDFFLLGGHSLLALQVVQRARDSGLHLHLRDLFEEPTVAGLARRARGVEAPAASEELITGPYEMTPGQRYFWTDRPHPPYILEVWPLAEPLVPWALRQALAAVLAHHDGLRSRFMERGGTVEARLEGLPPLLLPAALPLTWIDASRLPDAALDGWLEILPDFAGLFDLKHGPVLQLLAVDGGAARPGALVLAIHHLVSDGSSNRVIEEDLRLAYGQLLAVRPVRLPAKTTSLVEWGRRLRQCAEAADLPAELAYWLSPERYAVPALPEDDPQGDDTHRSTRCLAQRFSRALTRRFLGDTSAQLEARLEEILLMALAAALGEWSGHSAVLADLVIHGRDPGVDGVDLLRTVGWLSLGYPLLLDLPGAPEAPRQGLARLRDRQRQVPSGGFGWSLLHLRQEPEIVAALADKPVGVMLLNLLVDRPPPRGELDDDGEAEAMEIVPRPPERVAESELGGERLHQLGVYVGVPDGRLEVEWWYGGRHRPDSIRRLAEAFDRAVRAIVDEAPQQTPPRTERTTP